MVTVSGRELGPTARRALSHHEVRDRIATTRRRTLGQRRAVLQHAIILSVGNVEIVVTIQPHAVGLIKAGSGGRGGLDVGRKTGSARALPEKQVRRAADTGKTQAARDERRHELEDAIVAAVGDVEITNTINRHALWSGERARARRGVSFIA